MLTFVSILREQGVPLKIGVGQSHLMLIFSGNNHGQFTDVDFVDVVVDFILQSFQAATMDRNQILMLLLMLTIVVYILKIFAGVIQLIDIDD